jgi:hypothetical protein
MTPCGTIRLDGTQCGVRAMIQWLFTLAGSSHAVPMCAQHDAMFQQIYVTSDWARLFLKPERKKI